jgi:ABC-type transport system involved in multi-copper enzyme maturation permease subunit
VGENCPNPTHVDDLPYKEVERPARPFPVTQPIAWRERQISALSDWRLHATVLCTMAVFEWGWFFVDEGNHGDEISVIFDFGFLIISLLMVIGVTCRMFASERERQTLDLLLTTPLTNRELLNEKMSAANHTILFLMAPIFFAAMTHLVIGEVRVRATYNTTYSYYPTRIVQFYESEWWFTAVRYLFGHLTHAILYLTLVKWIAVFFSLKLNSQMKAMLGTIVTVLGLCILPAMLTALPFLFLGQNPEQAGYQIWFMTSPVFAFLFNEVHELSVMTRNGWWLDSEYITLLVNLAIYGALTLAVRTYVVRKLPTLLNRLDSETSDEHAG